LQQAQGLLVSALFESAGYLLANQIDMRWHGCE
jgi:hypothetical protein